MSEPELDNRCEQASDYFYDYLHLDTENPVPQQIREHIDACTACRAKVADLEQLLEAPSDGRAASPSPAAQMLKFHFAYVNRPVTCMDARPFIPAQLDQDLRVSVPSPINAHLDRCPACRKDLDRLASRNLARIELSQLSGILADSIARSRDLPHALDQFRAAADTLGTGQEYANNTQLSEIAEAILQRPDSGLETTYRFVDDSESLSAGCAYGSDYPVAVEINHRTQAQSRSGRIGGRIVALAQRRTLLKGAVAAAACIAIVAVMMINIQPAGAGGFHEVCNAISEATNVYIVRYTTNVDYPTEQIWVSRDKSIQLIKNDRDTILLDAGRRRMIRRSSGSTRTEQSQLSSEQADSIKASIRGFAGTVPYNSLDDLPDQAKWNRVSQDQTDAGTHVYELIIALGGPNGLVQKWRFNVDPTTNLPRVIEHSTNNGPDTEFTPSHTSEIHLISDADFDEAVNAAGLQL